MSIRNQILMRCATCEKVAACKIGDDEPVECGACNIKDMCHADIIAKAGLITLEKSKNIVCGTCKVITEAPFGC